MKRQIRLTESELNSLISKTIKGFINEEINLNDKPLIIPKDDLDNIRYTLSDLGLDANNLLSLFGLQQLYFTYLHGKLEEDAGTDLFYITHKEKVKSDGASVAYFKGKKCFIGQWHALRGIKQTGLVCYADDKESVEFMTKLYKEKSDKF